MNIGLLYKHYDFSSSNTIGILSPVVLRPIDQIPQGLSETDRVGTTIHIHSVELHVQFRPEELIEVGSPVTSYLAGDIKWAFIIDRQPQPTDPSYNVIWTGHQATAFPISYNEGRFDIMFEDIISTYVTTDREITNVDQSTGVVTSEIRPVTHYDHRIQVFRFDPPLRIDYDESGTPRPVAGMEPLVSISSPDVPSHAQVRVRTLFSDY